MLKDEMGTIIGIFTAECCFIKTILLARSPQCKENSVRNVVQQRDMTVIVLLIGAETKKKGIKSF